MFHGRLVYFQKPLLAGRPNTKVGDHGTPIVHNRWFILFYHMWGPTWVKIHWNGNWLRIRSHMTSHGTWGFVIKLHTPPGGGFENSSSNHETWSIWCHVEIHVDFTSILQSHTPLVPQAECEANLDQLCLFHQWECLKCNGHGLSVSCVKWP